MRKATGWSRSKIRPHPFHPPLPLHRRLLRNRLMEARVNRGKLHCTRWRTQHRSPHCHRARCLSAPGSRCAAGHHATIPGAIHCGAATRSSPMTRISFRPVPDIFARSIFGRSYKLPRYLSTRAPPRIHGGTIMDGMKAGIRTSGGPFASVEIGVRSLCPSLSKPYTLSRYSKAVCHWLGGPA